MKEEEKEKKEEWGGREDKSPGASALHLTASERHQSDAGVEDSLALYLRHEQGGDLGLHRAPDSSQVNRPFSYSQMWASQKQVITRSKGSAADEGNMRLVEKENL